MSLNNVKDTLETILKAQILGKGYKAGMWHYEDEPEPVAFEFELTRLGRQLLTDIAGDVIPREGFKRAMVVSGRVLCGICLESPFDVTKVYLKQPNLWGRDGVAGCMDVYCKSCRTGYEVHFEYPENWCHGYQINLYIQPKQEVFL